MEIHRASRETKTTKSKFARGDQVSNQHIKNIKWSVVKNVVKLGSHLRSKRVSVYGKSTCTISLLNKTHCLLIYD